VTATVDVAAAILTRPDGAFLLAQRPPRKAYAGYWEFPGGKLEPGESLLQALSRELDEELGIQLVRAYPWITRCFAYEHATVRLHFFRVLAWRGEPHGREGQAVAWTRSDALDKEPLLPANTPVLAALRLPTEYAISNAGEVGMQAFLSALERRLAGGLRLLQLREKTFSAAQREHLARKALAMVRAHGAQLVINEDIGLAQALDADGVQLTAAQAAATRERPPLAIVGVSCHSRADLLRADRLGASFAVLGPVRPTPTHPQAPTLSWQGFAEAAAQTPLPVYAIGGLALNDLETSWQHGAHGIAMIRGAWQRE
jgi:8-oxo-dGTP diphosphatase